MKVDLYKFQKAISSYYYSTVGYSSGNQKPVELDIEVINADPGNGIMTDIIRLTATTIEDGNTSHEERMVTKVLEIYPKQDGVAPRLTSTTVENVKIT